MTEQHSPSPEGIGDARTWCMVLHLSLLSGLVIPFGGLIVPVIIYILKKDTVPELVPHGQVVFNWIISVLIYGFIGFVLAFIIIGIPILIALFLLSLIFPIIGAIRASEGILWPYPLSIPIFNVSPAGPAGGPPHQ